MNLYRKTTIGEALAEALQELREKNELSTAQTDHIFTVFDSVYHFPLLAASQTHYLKILPPITFWP